MSPRTTTLLALAGVLLAGIPLPALTGVRPAEKPAIEAMPSPATQTCPCYVMVQFSRRPAQLTIRHEGRELAQLPVTEADGSCWETELQLPSTSVSELEVEALWPEETPTAQAVTLSLEPQGKEQRQCTQWTAPGDNKLHGIFLFRW